jgi:subtilisin family serine protease
MKRPNLARTLATVACSLALLGCGGGGGGEAAGPGGGGNPTPPPTSSPPPPAALATDIVVQLKVGASIDTLAARYGLNVLDQFGRRPIYRLRVAAGRSPTEALAQLRADSGVRFAELNAEGETPESRRVTVWAIGGDDGSYATQWAPQALRLASAHASSTGSGIRVAVLDTGIDASHPALAPKLARDGGGRLLGRDFVDDDAEPNEGGSRSDIGYGHGTHVAGLVALAAPGARLMPARVLDPQGRGNAWVLAEALGWALDPDANPATDDGAHVVNLSLGTLQPTQLLRTVTELATCEFDDDDDDFQLPGFDDDRIRCAAGRTAVVLAAAGNSGSESERLYPAAEGVKGALAVTASSENARLAPFANFGSWIGIAAPGEAIISTVPGGAWGVWSGSSMASPLAAGTAALVLASPAQNGDPTRPGPRQWTPEAVLKRLTDRSATLCGTSLRQVDAAAAVQDSPAPDRACP